MQILLPYQANQKPLPRRRNQPAALHFPRLWILPSTSRCLPCTPKTVKTTAAKTGTHKHTHVPTKISSRSRRAADDRCISGRIRPETLFLDPKTNHYRPSGSIPSIHQRNAQPKKCPLLLLPSFSLGKFYPKPTSACFAIVEILQPLTGKSYVCEYGVVSVKRETIVRGPHSVR